MRTPPVFSYLADDGEFPAFFDVAPALGGGVKIDMRGREITWKGGDPAEGARAELELDDGQVVNLAAALVRYLETRQAGGPIAYDPQTRILRAGGRDLVRFSPNEAEAFALLWPTFGTTKACPIEAIHDMLERRRGHAIAIANAYALVQSIRTKLQSKKAPVVCRNDSGVGYRLVRTS